MASVNPSAMVAESLSTHSKAVYQAFAEVEAQSRIEVARMVVDVREAKADRDKATKELHAVQLEAQNWKQEIVTTKAVLSQAELTIAHQAETIAQLRREVTQWKDQSRNWQEHFLRVEQERCAQSSRIDELVVEMQYPNQRTGSTALHTPKTMKYTDGVNSAPSSSSKRLSVTTSPTQPPVPPSPSTLDSSVTTPSTQTGGTNTQRRNKRAAKTQNERERDVPSMQANNDQEEGSSTGAKRPRKNHTNTNANAATSSTSTQGPTTVAAQQKPDAPATVRSSTVIRRVQAVIHVKREESYSEEEDPRHEALGAASTLQNASSSTTVKKKEESVEYQRYLRTPRRKIVEDEQYEDEDEDIDLGSDPLWGAAGRHQQSNQRSRFRQRSRINYQEEDDDDNEEEYEDDELMMGAEENHDEVYGTQPIEAHASHQSEKHSKAGRPAKKRKVTGR